MEELLVVLAELGGVASAAQLASAGCSRHHLQSALRAGAVLRVRRGWYALASVDPAELAAVRAGGLLTCVSALAARGVWVLSEDALHLAVPPNAVRSPARGLRLHWREWEGCGPESSSRDGIRACVLHAVACLPEEEAVMALDSVVDKGLLSFEDLMDLRGLAPVGRRRVFDLVVPGCQSGLETRVRLAGVRLGVRVRAQVFVPGVGHVDTVLGDCLAAETDGRAFHAGSVQLEEDYRRTLALQARGFVVVRLSSRQVLHDWARTEASLAQLIHRRQHLWTPSQRRRLHDEGWSTEYR
jgi:very-short-patch-repair endonuclease